MSSTLALNPDAIRLPPYASPVDEFAIDRWTSEGGALGDTEENWEAEPDVEPLCAVGLVDQQSNATSN
jgi:hypothetical protein